MMIKKTDLLESLTQYRQMLLRPLMETEDELSDEDQEIKDWESTQDVVTTHSATSDASNKTKVDGIGGFVNRWFNKDFSDVGTSNPIFRKEGEKQSMDIRKKSTYNEVGPRKKSNEEIKRDGSTLGDIRYIDDFGYPAILYDPEVLEHLGTISKDPHEYNEQEGWHTSDFILLKGIIKNGMMNMRRGMVRYPWVMTADKSIDMDLFNSDPGSDEPNMDVSLSVPSKFVSAMYEKGKETQSKSNNNIIKLKPKLDEIRYMKFGKNFLLMLPYKDGYHALIKFNGDISKIIK